MNEGRSTAYFWVAIGLAGLLALAPIVFYLALLARVFIFVSGV